MIMVSLEKLVLLVLLNFLAIFSSSDARKLKCDLVMCPACQYYSNDTYSDYAKRMINLNGPAEGSCSDDSIKYVHYGKDHGLSNDACCCLFTLPSKPGQNMVECPDSIKIGKNEIISHFYSRIAGQQKGAPENGFCRPETYKWIFAKEILGTSHNTCACFLKNECFIQNESSSCEF